MNTSSTLQLQQGQSLIEALFAMSIAVIAISVLAYLLLNAQVTVRQTIENSRANALAREGISAAYSITQNSFDDLSIGDHGLLLQDGKWEFSGSSDTSGKYTRSIALAQISEEVFSVTSNVEWEFATGRTSTTTHVTYVTNWQQTLGDAQYLTFDLSSLIYALPGTSIEGITLANTHTSSDVTLTELLFEWDGGQALYSVTISGLPVYTASTSGAIYSGELVDITDVNVGSGGIPISFGPLVFESDMQDSDLHVTSYMSDGSKRYMRIIP